LVATLTEKTGSYLVENIKGMSAEEAAVTAFLRLRLGELAKETKNQQRATATAPTAVA
jgi:hypothetical protein